jgi:sensor histidine kinase YesM
MMTKSVLKRMLVMPILLLIPVNILVIIMSLNIFAHNRREFVETMGNSLNLVAVQTRLEISDMRRSMEAYISGDADLLTLIEADRIDMNQTAYMKAVMHMQDEFDFMNAMHQNVFCSFMKLPYADSWWLNSNYATDIGQWLDDIRPESVEKGHSLELLRGKKNSMLLIIYNVNDTLIGFGYDASRMADAFYENSNLVDDIRIVEDQSLPEIWNRSGKIFLSRKIDQKISFQCNMSSLAIQRQIPVFSYVLIILSLLSVVVAPLLSLSYYRQIVTPTQELRKTFHEIRHGREKYRACVTGNKNTNEYVELAEYFNEMIDDLQKTKSRVYEIQMAKKEMELDYYSQQIRPHFILNVLNRIYTHEQSEWPIAKEEILYLTRYFRYVVNVRKRFVRLSDEMEFVKNFFNIEKMRFGKYFYSTVQWGVELKDVAVPPLIITTIVENSIKHALTNDGMCGIAVIARRNQEDVEIRIQDTGNGFPTSVLEAIQKFEKSGEKADVLGVGIANILMRLKILYGGRFHVAFYNDHGAVTDIRIPFQNYVEEGEKENLNNQKERIL